jgi:hypothetical protein
MDSLSAPRDAHIHTPLPRVAIPRRRAAHRGVGDTGEGPTAWPGHRQTARPHTVGSSSSPATPSIRVDQVGGRSGGAASALNQSVSALSVLGTTISAASLCPTRRSARRGPALAVSGKGGASSINARRTADARHDTPTPPAATRRRRRCGTAPNLPRRKRPWRIAAGHHPISASPPAVGASARPASPHGHTLRATLMKRAKVTSSAARPSSPRVDLIDGQPRFP